MMMSDTDIAISLMSVPSVTPAQHDVVGTLIDIVGSDFRQEHFVFAYETNKMVYNIKLDLPGNSLKPSLCFAGHLDVVSPGNFWTSPPFSPEIRDGVLYGRGATDMKAAIACFVAALQKARSENIETGSISLILTGDEEHGGKRYSMEKIVEILDAREEHFDLCILGEPTSVNTVVDHIKNGARGSCNFDLTIYGKQGHAAYSNYAVNPIDGLFALANQLSTLVLDKGTKDFQASKLIVTDVDANNKTRNIIPGAVNMLFNIRFNDIHTPESLHVIIDDLCKKILNNDYGYLLKYKTGSLPYLSQPSEYTSAINKAIHEVTGSYPVLSADGATSDGRFLYKIAPVIEVGSLYNKAHAVDECISISDLKKLTMIYYNILCNLYGK